MARTSTSTSKHQTLKRVLLGLLLLAVIVAFSFVVAFYAEIVILIIGFVPFVITSLAQALNQKV